MRKWENIRADPVDQRFVFVTWIEQSLYFLSQEFQASSCTAWFVSDLVGNFDDRFSRDASQM